MPCPLSTVYRSKMFSLQVGIHPFSTTKIAAATGCSASDRKRDRRNLLIGIGSLYAAGTVNLCSDPLAFAVPNAQGPMNKGAPEAAPAAAAVLPATLDKKVKIVVRRPKKSRSKREKEEQEEVLVVEGINFICNTFVKFDVYINDEDETGSSPDKTEFAGSFAHLPYGKDKNIKNASLEIGIGQLLEDLGADDDDEVVVTLFPRSGTDKLTVGNVKIVLDS